MKAWKASKFFQEVHIKDMKHELHLFTEPPANSGFSSTYMRQESDSPDDRIIDMWLRIKSNDSPIHAPTLVKNIRHNSFHCSAMVLTLIKGTL